MAFEKKVWIGGDTVTAAHLNRIENGIEEAMNSQPDGPVLPEITAADDGKVMVAKNGEWTNEDLLTVGTEHVILPETEGVSIDSEYDIDLTAFPSVPPTDLQYIAVHNGRRYELGAAQTPKGYFAVYPPDFDLTQAIDDNKPEVAIEIVQGDGTSMCVVAALPEDTSHTLTLMAKAKTVVKNEHIPFAIKAGDGLYSIAEGYSTVASGTLSHAEGQGTTASGYESHAEGETTTASGECSHAEGIDTTASGSLSHAEGDSTTANHRSQHVFGEFNVADPSTAEASDRGTYVEIVGNGTSDGITVTRSNARTLDWSGNEVLAGKLTVGAAPTADMDVATKKYVDDNAGGAAVVIAGTGVGSTVQGVFGNEDATNNNQATANYAHVEGGYAYADPDTGYMFYFTNTASGIGSHAEGRLTTASGQDSHAEGNDTTASNKYSHAEGDGTTASGHASHAEGAGATASGPYSHAEGDCATSSGPYSHAEGSSTTASGDYSHAEGCCTIANHAYQHVFGRSNIADPSTAEPEECGTYIEIVGNGEDIDTRSNARTLDWNGNETLAGSLTLGKGTADEVTVTAAQLKALIAMLST